MGKADVGIVSTGGVRSRLVAGTGGRKIIGRWLLASVLLLVLVGHEIISGRGIAGTGVLLLLTTTGLGTIGLLLRTSTGKYGLGKG